MTPERWHQIHTLFDTALRHDPADRATFVAQAAAADPDLRAEVEDLLAHDELADRTNFLETPRPANGQRQAAAGERPDVRIGRRVGPYVLRKRLGSGGMGSVYLAVRRRDFRQQVALKLIRGGLETEEALQRFRTERQILAGLQHPHIARLLDGGTTAEGLPYLVMEYVAGQPLHRYCASRSLSLRERLQLLHTICAAVEYAHGHTVVHRDLKPGNVLITDDGTPKLTDFGLAKHLAMSHHQLGDREKAQAYYKLAGEKSKQPEHYTEQRQLLRAEAEGVLEITPARYP